MRLDQVFQGVARRCDRHAVQNTQKDRSQAAFLIRVPADEDPHALTEAHHDALSKGPGMARCHQRSVKTPARGGETASATKLISYSAR